MAASAASAAAAVSSTSTTSSVFSNLANNVNFVGPAWIVSSAIFTTYSTTKFLKYQHVKDLPTYNNKDPHGISYHPDLSRPNLLTLYRFAGSLLLGLLLAPYPNFFHIMARIQETISMIPIFCLPAAFLFLANFANSISLDRIGISLTYTTKCGIPLVTVLLTLLLDGKAALPPIPALLSLFPIAGGIAMASWNHPHFEALGFVASLVSLTAQSALNVSSKRAMQKTNIAGPEAQRAMVAVGLAITLVYSIVRHAATSTFELEENKSEKQPPAWLAMFAAVSYHVEYVLSFMFVKLVEPITYGACDAVRRLGIIISGHYMFGGPPFSALNLMGIATALLGALAYSITS